MSDDLNEGWAGTDDATQHQIRQWIEIFSPLEFIPTHDLKQAIQDLTKLGYAHIATVIQNYIEAR